ncbi:MAG: hypothetical protein MCS20_01960, partial [Candidatus Phytoplasma mali]|nr:hypothetical protein [Candidatus Phytoplasma mali]
FEPIKKKKKKKQVKSVDLVRKYYCVLFYYIYIYIYIYIFFFLCMQREGENIVMEHFIICMKILPKYQ